jgi:hypothetical protein
MSTETRNFAHIDSQIKHLQFLEKQIRTLQLRLNIESGFTDSHFEVFLRERSIYLASFPDGYQMESSLGLQIARQAYNDKKLIELKIEEELINCRNTLRVFREQIIKETMKETL